MKIEPKFLGNKLVFFLFSIIFSCSSKSEKTQVKKEKKSIFSKEVLDCNAEKKYESIIYYTLPQSNSFIIQNDGLSKLLRNHFKKKYIGLKKINNEKIFSLNSSFFAITFNCEIRNCGKLSFFGVIDKITNKVLDTYFIFNEEDEFRWEFYDKRILVYKKIVFIDNENSIKRNCMISFDFNKNKIHYTLADADERIKW